MTTTTTTKNTYPKTHDSRVGRDQYSSWLTELRTIIDERAISGDTVLVHSQEAADLAERMTPPRKQLNIVVKPGRKPLAGLSEEWQESLRYKGNVKKVVSARGLVGFTYSRS